MRVDLLMHIVAGSLGILSGFVALFVVKGATGHRRSGMVFVYSMLVMGLMGSAMALARNIAPAANGPVGFLTAYLVVTGLIAVRPPSNRARVIEIGLLAVALLIAAFSFFLGQAKVIPKPIRILPLLLTPPLLVLVTMLYWMWRMRFRPHSKRGPKVEWSPRRPEGIMLAHSFGARNGSRSSDVGAVHAGVGLGGEHGRGTG